MVSDGSGIWLDMSGCSGNGVDMVYGG